MPLSPCCWNFHGRGEHLADVVELRRRDLHPDVLAVLAIQPRLGIERIDLRRPAIHIEEDHTAGLRFVVQLAQHAACAFDLLAVGRLAQQAGKSDCPKAPRAAREHLTARDGNVKSMTVVHEHVAARQLRLYHTMPTMAYNRDSAKRLIMKRTTSLLLGAAGAFVVVFGLLCLNYTKASGLEHHKAVAQRHGLPPPSNVILFGGAGAIILGSGMMGYVLGARKQGVA